MRIFTDCNALLAKQERITKARRASSHNALASLAERPVLQLDILIKRRYTMAKKKLKKGYVICNDCGRDYKEGSPHAMFCPAHTCDECGSSYGYVVRKDGGGRRVCDRCLEKLGSE